MTQMFSQRFPIQVRTGWTDFSPALRQYASKHIATVLEPYVPQIRSVTLRISGADPRRPAQRRCDVQVSTDTGPISARLNGFDLFALVDRAAETILLTLHQRSSGALYTNVRQKIA